MNPDLTLALCELRCDASDIRHFLEQRALNVEWRGQLDELEPQLVAEGQEFEAVAASDARAGVGLEMNRFKMQALRDDRAMLSELHLDNMPRLWARCQASMERAAGVISELDDTQDESAQTLLIKINAIEAKYPSVRLYDLNSAYTSSRQHAEGRILGKSLEFVEALDEFLKAHP